MTIDSDQKRGRRAVWLTWEDHRRSRELARHFQADYCPILTPVHGLLRYPRSLIATARLLLRRRPTLVYCQNPSVVLAAFLGVAKKIGGFRLIEDRHSNYLFVSARHPSVLARLADSLGLLADKLADVVIVTNLPLAERVRQWARSVQVLPDPIPEFEVTTAPVRQTPPVFTVVSTYAADEPIDEVIEAFNGLGIPAKLQLTGNSRRFLSTRPNLLATAKNLTFLGFLDYGHYVDRLAKSDVVIVLTKQESTLNCGAYEALALGRPAILSDSRVIKSYFCAGVVHTAADVGAIRHAMRTAVDNWDSLRIAAVELSAQRRKEWADMFESVRSAIAQIQSNRSLDDQVEG